MKFHVSLLLMPSLLAMACGEVMEVQTEEEVTSMLGYQTRVFALEAPCMVNVEGIGLVDIENDYIPGVVACENGGAPLEALKAQAVQARGFLYYKLFVAGVTTIRNSTADQVYRCSYRPNGPEEIHRQAARETKGQYLTWNDKVVAPFYVAAAIPPNPDPENPLNSCKGIGGSDPTGTEKWVTYNIGKSNCTIQMTNLGWVPNDCNRNPHNRGCASQNGEACLARVGWKYQDMMDFYYGSDIKIVNSTGTCGGPAPYEVTDYDRFCGLKADGSYCFDASVRVDCTETFASANQLCPGDCTDGACVAVEEPTDETCGERADGAHCVGNVTRVECEGNVLSMTETCPNGCDGGECQEAPTNNTNPNNTNPNNTNPNNTNLNNTNPNNTNPNNSNPPVTPGQFPALVSTSKGTTTGCSTTGGSLSPLMLLALGFFWRQRR